MNETIFDTVIKKKRKMWQTATNLFNKNEKQFIILY